ncbi:MAG: hypothetical protein ACLRZ7_12740 [Lachnospiraceae bacterium]
MTAEDKKKKQQNSQFDYGNATFRVLILGFKIALTIAIVAMFYFGITFGYRFGYAVFYSTPLQPDSYREINFTVKEGESTLEVGRRLKNDGIIENEYVFLVQSICFEFDIQPGDYSVSPSMDTRQLLELLSANRSETNGSQGQ